MIHNLRNLKLRQFYSRIQYFNNIPPPPPFPSFRKTEKIYQVKINKTMLHTLPHEWKKQAVMLGFDFGDETLRYVLEQFKLMKLKEKI